MIPGADLSRTVGWFTTIHPVRLDLTGIDLEAVTSGAAATGATGGGVLEALKVVKEQLRAAPDHGIGYGALRYLRTAQTSRMLPYRRSASTIWGVRR